MLGRKLNLDEPRAVYQRGWGPNAADMAEVIASWSLTMQDLNDRTTTITFDVMDDNSPITMGMDIKRFSITDNTSEPKKLIIHRPSDKEKRVLQTYIAQSDPLQARLRLMVIPKMELNSAMLGEVRRPDNIRPLTMAKRLHALTHAAPDELIRICREARWSSDELEEKSDT